MCDFYFDNVNNEFCWQWGECILQVCGVFGDFIEDCVCYFLFNGLLDVCIFFNCMMVIYLFEVWFYQCFECVGFEFFLIFYWCFGWFEFIFWNLGLYFNDFFDVGVGNSQGRGIQQVFEEVWICRDGDVVVVVIV